MAAQAPIALENTAIPGKRFSQPPIHRPFAYYETRTIREFEQTSRTEHEEAESGDVIDCCVSRCVCVAVSAPDLRFWCAQLAGALALRLVETIAATTSAEHGSDGTSDTDPRTARANSATTRRPKEGDDQREERSAAGSTSTQAWSGDRRAPVETDTAGRRSRRLDPRSNHHEHSRRQEPVSHSRLPPSSRRHSRASLIDTQVRS